MGIKLKFLSGILFLSLFLGQMTLTFSEKCNAESNGVDLSFVGEPTYYLTRTIARNNVVVARNYLINVTIKNSGNVASEATIINLTDSEGFTLVKNSIFTPGETKIITFQWSTMINDNQKINIAFYPDNSKTVLTSYNSGSISFSLNIASKSLPATSTPGFELVLLIIASAFSIIILKKNKN